MVSPARPDGLRDRKKAKVRAELIATALSLFEEQGFERTTVQQIADAVLVSRRTFHRYFGSKEEVVFGHEEDVMVSLLTALDARPAGESALTALRHALREYLLDEAAADDREQLSMSIRRVRRLLQANPALRRANFTGAQERAGALARHFAARAGMVADDLRPQLTAATCSAALAVGMDIWAQEEDASVATLHRQLDAVVVALRAGVDLPAGSGPHPA